MTVTEGQEGDVMLVALKTEEGSHKARNVGILRKSKSAGKHSPREPSERHTSVSPS